MRYLDELDSAVYEGDTLFLKTRTEQLLEIPSHYRLPRLVALIHKLAESAETCDLGLSLETVESMRKFFTELEADGIDSPDLPRAERNIFS